MLVGLCLVRLRDKRSAAEEPLLGLEHDHGVRRLRANAPAGDAPSCSGGRGSPKRELEDGKHV